MHWKREDGSSATDITSFCTYEVRHEDRRLPPRLHQQAGPEQQAIRTYDASKDAVLIDTFTEVESGKNNERPELEKALHLAKVTGATRVIAKLDRLSRNATFLLTLRDSGVKIVAADMPDANGLTVGIMVVFGLQARLCENAHESKINRKEISFACSQ